MGLKPALNAGLLQRSAAKPNAAIHYANAFPDWSEYLLAMPPRIIYSTLSVALSAPFPQTQACTRAFTHSRPVHSA